MRNHEEKKESQFNIDKIVNKARTAYFCKESGDNCKYYGDHLEIN